MSRIKAGLELAVELKEEEQLEEIQTEPTEETVEEFQEESLEDTIAEIDESFDLAVEGIWGDFKRDFLGAPRAGTAGQYFNHLAQKYAGKNKTLSAYYSIMAGKTPPHIDDPEKFKHDVENNVPLKMQIDRDLKDAKMSAQMNEINEPVVENIKTEHNLIANILKKYGWEATSEEKSPGVLVKVYTNPDFPDEHINQYFSPRGRLARWNHIRETDGEYLKIAIGSAELKKYMRKLNPMNELKEPVDYHDDDPEEYLKTLNPKDVKDQYKKTLPKGHTDLYKKFKQLKEISDEMVDRYRVKKNDQLSNILGKAKGDMDARVFDKDDVNTVMKRMRGTDLDVARIRRQIKMRENEDDGNLYTFRVLCTLKDYDHPMVSKRGEDIMKTVRVTAATPKEAINKAKRHYKLKGYEVMDAEVVEKLPASGEQINEGYEDRVKQVAQRLMPRLSYPMTKESLISAIENAAYDVPDMKVPSAAKDFIKDVYQAVKQHVKWAKKTAPAKPKMNLQTIGNMVMDAISHTFPDGDPIDFIVPKLRKLGVNTDAGVEKLLDKALKSIGYKGGYYNTLADFWDEMKAQADYDAQHGHPSHLNLGDKNPWRIKEDSQLDEISMGKAIKAYGASGTSGDYMTDKEYNQQHRLRGHIKRKFGDKAADHADAHWQSQFTGRAYPQGKDPLTSRPKPKGLTKAGKLSKTDTGVMKRDIKSRLGMSEEAGEATNPKDKVTLDIPLLIRLLEYAREDAKTDMDLHDLTEKLIAMGSEGGRTLSMKDYDQLVQHVDTTDEPTKIDENYGALTTELAAQEFHDEVAAIMTSLADKYKSQTKPEGSVASAPNTQTMRATVSGMIQYSPNQVTHEGGFTREYLDFLKIGSGVDMSVKRSMRAELAKALQHVVSGFAAEPGFTIKTSDGYTFTYDEEYGSNWGGFGFKVRKATVTEGFRNHYSVGDRVMTPTGSGTIVWVSPEVNVDDMVRVKLDDPSKAGEDGLAGKDTFRYTTGMLKFLSEGKNPAMKRAKLVAKMEKNAPSFKKAMKKKEEVKENNRNNRLDDLYDREMRKLDKELKAGHITQAVYNKQARNLNRELEDEDNEQLNEVYVIHKVKGSSSTQLPKISFKSKKEAKDHVADRMAKRSDYDKEQGIKFEYRKNKMGGLKPERIAMAKKIGKKEPKK